MKYRNITTWNEDSKTPELLYFVQLLEEMLFDFSLDTYKPSVMNASLLCLEAIETINQIEEGNIKTPNIYHVVEELAACLEKDVVAQTMLPIEHSIFYPDLKNKKTPIKELKNVLELLSVNLYLDKYLEKNKQLLCQAILEKNSFSDIRRLTRTLITSLVSIDYNQKFILNECINFFYSNKNRIESISDVEAFLSKFDCKTQSFTIIFRVDQIFEHTAKAIEKLSVKITREIPQDIDLSKFNSFKSHNNNKLFAIISDIKAFDVYTARERAEYMLKLISTTLGLFHHKESPNWTSECIVHSIDNNISIKLAKPINSMHKCADLKPMVASKKLTNFITSFSLDRDSFNKFFRSAELHSMALASNTDENQILNLWIALESLIPSETKGDDVSNIEHITASLIPFLNMDYIESLLNNLVKDLLRWNSLLTRKTLKNIPAKKIHHKLAKLLVCNEYASELNTLESSFNDYHLLKDRVELFKVLLSSPKNITTALDAHKVRLEWQIRRIYRARNIIVHSGNTPDYIRPLIEHSHNYLDIVLTKLVDLASNNKTIYTVGQGFKLVSLQYNTYLKKLGEKNLAFTNDNLETLLFCYSSNKTL
ncbi:hypothetical protein [uncultured Tolumonas sp.]|uniref:hypothetical protein n=1 Tax=uncultured Tolumonas sp. TaxID=263765 RepID=UPI002A0A159C|nr:hypothetical protein [uncultured Tolumonas sp.]